MSRFQIATLLILVLLTGCARQVYRSEPMPSSISVAHKLIIAEDKSSSVQFELKYPYEKLAFRKHDAEYRAEARITCRAENRDDGRIETLIINDVVTCEKFSLCHSTEDFIKKSFPLPLGPGDWDVELDLYPSAGGRFWRKVVLISVPRPEDGSLFLDGPTWSSPAAESPYHFPIRFHTLWNLTEDHTGFVEGLSAKVTLECALICWDELEVEGEFILSLQDRRGNMVWFNRRPAVVRGGRNPQSWTIPVDQLTAGAYLLKVDFVGPEGRNHLEGRLDVGLTRADFDRGWTETLGMITPLATVDELDDFKNATEHVRPTLWLQFWNDRDPNGAAAGNSYRDLISQRITDANLLFSSNRNDGYLSDRGQVYLEMGAPDRVETMSDERSYHTILTWYYTRLGRIYIFESGYGGDGFVLTRVTG